MTPWINFTSKGSYELGYYSFAEGEAGTEYYLELSNGNDRAIDVAGRWTP
jgi:hypothetical protein